MIFVEICIELVLKLFRKIEERVNKCHAESKSKNHQKRSNNMTKLRNRMMLSEML